MPMIDCVWEEYTETVEIRCADGVRRVDQQRIRCVNPGCKHKFPPVHKDTGLVKFPLNGRRPRWACEYQPDLIPIAEKLGISVDDLHSLREYREEEAEKKVAEIRAGAEKLGVTWDDAKHYAEAVAKWTRAGWPVRTQEEVTRIWEECCEPCEELKDGRCRKCGCCVSDGRFPLTNKLKMATETCPIEKWK